MINLLIGQPGGGKSYESVAYHLIPAIESGRKVITNLPLNLEHFVAVYGQKLVDELIEVRHKTLATPVPMEWAKLELMFKRFGMVPRLTPFINRVFANLVDYDNSWRHPITGAGVLYIIDECHFCLPYRGTPIEVEEWFSMHRHESADVLLITQSYGKISQSIRDLVQVCYRVKKGTAFGSSNKYIRKVQDGIRGGVVNTDIREYDKKFFPFYQSHTKGGGTELAAEDIRPWYKHWTAYGAGIMLVIFLGIVIMMLSKPAKSSIKPIYQVPAPVQQVPSPFQQVPSPVQQVPAPVQQVPSPVPADKPKEPDKHDPYADSGIHLVGHVIGKDKEGKVKERWILSLSQNGQRLQQLYSSDFEKVGYKFEGINQCAAWLTFGTEKRFIKCDSPTLSIASVASIKH